MRSILEILQDARRLMIAGEYLELVACLTELQGHPRIEDFQDVVARHGYSRPSSMIVQDLLRWDMRGKMFQDGLYDLAMYAELHDHEWGIG
jgi:hypothetical protein